MVPLKPDSAPTVELGLTQPVDPKELPVDIAIYGNPGKDAVPETLRCIVLWARERRVNLFVEAEIAGQLEASLARDIETFDGDCSATQLLDGRREGLLVTLGGDGTLLHGIRRLWPFKADVLGVSLGSLSFNASVDAQNVTDAIEEWIEGRSKVSPRLLLRVTHEIDSKPVREAIAVNDVVLAKLSGPRLIHLCLRQGEELVSSFAGDGLILATPTGSTAYNLSAGGPIVYPTLEAFIATAICPHTLTARPVVLPSRPAVTMEFLSDHHGSKARLSIDGQEDWPVEPGEKIRIEICNSPMRLITPSGIRYFARLREKLSWTGDLDYKKKFLK